MRAVVVTPGEKNSGCLKDLPMPDRARGSYLVRVIEVGIDGTDREIDAGLYGEPPAGEQQLVLGHESLGEVVEECEGVSCFQPGDLVVATVRRPCPERCLNCRNGEYDFCLTGNYQERGIKQADGFLADYFTERPEFLIGVPRELRDVAVLLEPLSIVEKAFRQIFKIQQRMLWQPRRLMITGGGSIGILAAYVARLRGLETTVYSRGEAGGVRASILREIGAEYVNSNNLPLTEAAAQHGVPDIVIEVTGHSPLAWEVAGILGTNGVAALLSVASGQQRVEIPSDKLNDALVLGNRLLFGSVNAHHLDFEQGVADLQAAAERWPNSLKQFITHRIPLSAFNEALNGKQQGELKTVLTVAEPVHA